MSRRARKLAESGIYHVMLRGTERKDVFIDDEDKNRITETICEKRILEGFKLYSYCIMDNHIHLALKENKETVSQAVKRIATSYAYYFNKKYNRIGHLFQDRFRSEPIKNDAQLLTLIRYIHNNPVKANIVSCARDYKWSSYCIYDDSISQKNIKADFQLIREDMGDILSMYSTDKNEAIKEFINFTNEIVNEVFVDLNISDKEIDNVRNRQIIDKTIKEIGIDKTDLMKDREKLEVLISRLKNDEGISLRQISQHLGINRGLVLKMAEMSKQDRPQLTQLTLHP